MSHLPAAILTTLLVILTVLLAVGLLSCNDADSRRMDQIPPYVRHPVNQPQP